MLLCKIHMPLGPWCCVLYLTKLWKFSTVGSWYPASMVTAGAGAARARSFPTSFLSFWDPAGSGVKGISTDWVKVTVEVLVPSAPYCCRNIEVWHAQAPFPAPNKTCLPGHKLSHQQEAAPWTSCFYHEMLWLFIRSKQSLCRMVTAFWSPLKS